MSSERSIPLGRVTPPPDRYDPSLLFPIERAPLRAAIGCERAVPFLGADLWTAYELSWLDARGRPDIAILELAVPASSPRIVESKSLKLYLGSLANALFASRDEVAERVGHDVGELCGTELGVALSSPSAFASRGIADLAGHSIDDEEIGRAPHAPSADLLACGDTHVDEALRTSLFRAVCPVTGQPDYADVLVRYRGPSLDRASLLRYLVSYRTHPAFHEQCVERIFVDIAERARPEALTVHACFARRGGIAIAPFRSSFEPVPEALVPSPRQ